MPERIYRKDYKVSPYLISQTELWFDVVDSGVIVKSKIHFYRNELSKDRLDNLFLNGENLELIDLKINHQPASFEKKEDGLLLKDLNDKFVLEISNKIYPERNTSLEGLYLSNGNYCTQCEAHGFRKITYYLDRPDVLSIFTTHIKADKDSLPVQLSNGNPVELNNGYVSWHDPQPKPCYLFALVMGNLSSINDTFITKSGKKISLDIFVEPRNIHKTDFAMQALKRAFKWDEERFNLEYDLDKFMIVAVDDFNMGAMENKGLNIFNSSYVLADERTATDVDFINIESVIGHEYFHNWTGNRVTCRDWFQLSLKEGLTVFRDQEFTSDLHSRSVKRIEDVFALKSFQFPEDAGPMSHPVRPDSYIEMNNFYTATVYEKGAEVIRMIHTIIGEDKFQEGMQNYFKRYDHQAVTIDDFVNSMNEVSDHDFTQFMNWYSRAGTPRVKIDFKPKAKKGTMLLVWNKKGSQSMRSP
jgi:aminopeptidase N